MATSHLSEDYVNAIDLITRVVLDEELSDYHPSRESPYTPELLHQMRDGMISIIRSGGSKEEIKASLRQYRTEQERQLDEIYDDL